MRNISLRAKLNLSFSTVILIGVFLSVIIGIRLISNTIIRQAQDKVRLDLNSAREVYQTESAHLKNIIRLTALRFFIIDGVLKDEKERLKIELQKIRENESLDILNLIYKNGNTAIYTRNRSIHDNQKENPVLKWVISKKNAVVSTQIISQKKLEREDKTLANQARIILIPTSKARPRKNKVETSGMMIVAASPVLNYNGQLIAVLYGGKLLNKNNEIVDKVKDIVYRGERYKGKDIGTATIFQGDLRISTNVKMVDGTRAIGTRVSKEVYHQVIERGFPWMGRAFVVNDWYITAYEPIKNLEGKIIGMIYVGMLEAPYIELKNRIFFIFLFIAFMSIILLSIISFVTSENIIKPLKTLLLATKKVALGNLSYRIQIKSNDEIGQLADSFNQMTVELQNTTEKYLQLNRTLEDKVRKKSEELKKTQDQLIQSEKLTSLGKMAAGIAHEINNPLTSILMNAHLILENKIKNKSIREMLKLIIEETTRCSSIVKGLLEFSRQTLPFKKLSNINIAIKETMLLLKSQIIVNKVTIEEKLDKRLPCIMIDVNKIKQVFTNITLNALDAMSKGGKLTIISQLSNNKQFLEIIFQDNGVGISEENIGKIFDPFFTTKGIKGNGLGLSVSYGIIQQHMGIIKVHSKVGKGTEMIICLPAKKSNNNKFK